MMHSHPWKATSYHLTTLSSTSLKVGLTMTFPHNCQRESGCWNSRLNPGPQTLLLLLVVLYCTSKDTNPPLLELKSHRPYTEFHFTHVVCCQINSWYRHNWCGEPLDGFFVPIWRTSAQEMLPHHVALWDLGWLPRSGCSSWGTGWKNCWYLKGSPEAEEGYS